MYRLKAAGHTITFDWTRDERRRGRKFRQWKAEQDANGVMNADVLVVLLPGRYGTHTETGVAIGVGIPVYVLGLPDTESIYWDHPLVHVVASEKELLKILED